MDILKIVREELKKFFEQKNSENDLDEIDLSINSKRGARPGINRRFPEENPEGGHSLNLSVDDGPHEFPHEEDLI